MKKIYSGKIWTGSFGENDSTLFIGYNSQPLAERFEYDFRGKQVSIRYWLSTKEMTKEELTEEHLKNISGGMSASYYDKFSEYTGYLWTEEYARVGGHDLLKELYSNVGKFLYMEIEYDNERKT